MKNVKLKIRFVQFYTLTSKNGHEGHKTFDLVIIRNFSKLQTFKVEMSYNKPNIFFNFSMGLLYKVSLKNLV